MSKTKKSLVVRVETYWGQTMVYPVCPTSELFATIAGTKTLTSKTLNRIKQLGYSIVVEAPELDIPLLVEGE